MGVGKIVTTLAVSLALLIAFGIIARLTGMDEEGMAIGALIYFMVKHELFP